MERNKIEGYGFIWNRRLEITEAEGECQILLDENEWGVRQEGRWAAADSSQVWDKKTRSERALCKGEWVGRDREQWALKHGKLEALVFWGMISPSWAIQTFHKAQESGTVRAFSLKEIIACIVCFNTSEIHKWLLADQNSKDGDGVQVVQCHSSLLYQQKCWCSLAFNSCSVNLLLKK